MLLAGARGAALARRQRGVGTAPQSRIVQLPPRRSFTPDGEGLPTGVDIWKMESPELQLVWTLTPTMRSCVSVSVPECYEELYEEARRGGLLSLFGARFQSRTFHRSQLCELITICGA